MPYLREKGFSTETTDPEFLYTPLWYLFGALPFMEVEFEANYVPFRGREFVEYIISTKRDLYYERMIALNLFMVAGKPMMTHLRL